jgi:6-pyruvoyltetrahydropterin/6-carboxytetrahydropterin synthase
MYEVSVTGRFRAGHQLCDANGPTEPLHEHDWQVIATWAGERLDAHGLLVDFTAVRGRLDDLLAGLDGRNLNELAAFAGRNPSAENVARHIAEGLVEPSSTARLTCVAVEEEPGCVARCFPYADSGSR